MSPWQRSAVVLVVNLLGFILLAGINHALSGWNVFLLLHGLFVLFAGLRMPFAQGFIVTCITATLACAFLYQTAFLPWYLLSFLAVYSFLYRVRLKVRRNFMYSLLLVGGVANGLLFLLLSLFTFLFGESTALLSKLLVDFACSFLIAGVLSRWILNLHFSIFFLLGTNLHKEVVS